MASDGVSVGRDTGSRAAEWRFQWVSSVPSPAEVMQLEAKYPEVVQIPVSELEDETQEWLQRAVLMRALNRWVPVEAFIREFRRGGISGEIIPLSLASRCYIFKFADAMARDMVLQRPWIINGQLISSEEWRPDFFPAADAISKALVWIRMPNLPIEFWREDFLRGISAPAGQFLYADAATRAKSRGGYARVCVRVDLRDPLRPGVRVRGATDPFWIQFVYEQVEGICPHCGSVHLCGNCPASSGSATVIEKEAPLFGAWMAATRQRRENPGPQVVGRMNPRSGAVPLDSAPRKHPSVPGTAPGSSTEGWSAPAKFARRRRTQARLIQGGLKEVMAWLQG